MFQERKEGCASRRGFFVTTHGSLGREFFGKDSLAEDVGRGRVSGLIVFETAKRFENCTHSRAAP